MQTNILHLGDNLETIKTLPDNSVDAIITDSPYGLGKEPDATECLHDWITKGYHEVKGTGFMGKKWDAFVPQPVLWIQCFRVLKPGGYLLSFFGTRTYDWGTLAIRLAGFEIRDQIMWVYGSGFPKSLDVSKAFDKAAGAEREVVGTKDVGPDFTGNNYARAEGERRIANITVPATYLAKQWEGFGTALKPACEPICVARKPLEGTVIQNVEKWGVGAINVNAGRVETDENLKGGHHKNTGHKNQFFKALDNTGCEYKSELGRWPANLIHDGSEEVLESFPDAGGQLAENSGGRKTANVYGDFKTNQAPPPRVEANKSAARFFYCAKASPTERANRKHPTIKPLSLMEYLVKVFCPPGGICLDPHIGSGTTAVACLSQGRQFIGCDDDKASYIEAMNHIGAVLHPDLY